MSRGGGVWCGGVVMLGVSKVMIFLVVLGDMRFRRRIIKDGDENYISHFFKIEKFTSYPFFSLPFFALG